MAEQIFQIAPSTARIWWIYAVMGGVVVLLAGVFVFVHFVVNGALHAAFTVGDGTLAVRGGVYGRTLSIRDLDLGRARVVNLETDREFAPRRRTNGTNLPGLKAGWFRLRNKEKALLFLTDTANAVHIPTTKGYGLLLSPSAPKRFLEALRRAQ